MPLAVCRTFVMTKGSDKRFRLMRGRWTIHSHFPEDEVARVVFCFSVVELGQLSVFIFSIRENFLSGAWREVCTADACVDSISTLWYEMSGAGSVTGSAGNASKAPRLVGGLVCATGIAVWEVIASVVFRTAAADGG